MYIKQLRTFNFRNLINQTVEFSPGLNLILGKNGQGKTNLIEAINFLSLGRSFRTARQDELIRWSDNEASVFALLITGESEVDLGIVLEKGAKQGYCNGAKVQSLTDFVGKLTCVTFSPTDLALVKGPPQERRRFIDRHIVDLQPSYMRHLLSYQRAIQNKRKILKEVDVDSAMLRPWNQLLAEEAVHILKARTEFLAQMEQRLERIHYELFGTAEVITLSLNSKIERTGEQASSYEGVFEQFLKVEQREIATGAPVIGPHRDDVDIFINGQDSRAFASQGQARATVLSLKVAAIELIEEARAEPLIILLDDVESELDSARLARFYKKILSGERQTFITSTDFPDLVEHEARLSIKVVEEGRVTAKP